MLQSLAAQFPGSDWVTNAAATAQYNLRNFDEAQELFEDLLERDPHRIEVWLPSALCQSTRENEGGKRKTKKSAPYFFVIETASSKPIRLFD